MQKKTVAELENVRTQLIEIRSECLVPGLGFDAAGAVILSHAIRWLSFKVEGEGKPYEPTKD